MRPLIVKVSKGQGQTVLEKVQQFEGKNSVLLPGQDANDPIEVVITAISNRKVEGFVDALEELQAQITLFPQGIMPMYPPTDQAPEQVTDVEVRSPIEVFLAGLQSIGSWKGFIGYAFVASVVVWIGLFTNNSFLLVAAMLIAPFAGPAMNTAIATARGDWELLRQGLIRYFIALFISVAGTCLLSLLLGQEIATAMMVDQSQISATAVLLPIAAGVAGALNLVQSERDSLVSGAATGMLVAASLAPPTGVVGMSVALGEWQMAKGALFLLFLQLVGINLSGSLVFRLFGLTPQGARYHRGKKKIVGLSGVISLIVLVLLLVWQFGQTPNLQRSSVAQRAAADIQKIVDDQPYALLVESDIKFTRANISGQNTLLCTIYVQKPQSAELTSEAIKAELTTIIQRELLEQNQDITPLVAVTVLEPPF
jgi:uncharacterized hydrophobic protein (TIGR00271 family)